MAIAWPPHPPAPAPAPLLHADTAASAAAILDRADVVHGRMVSVDRDSILFLGETVDGTHPGAYTAWINGTSVFMIEAGFVATEPVGLHDRKVATNYGISGGAV